MPNQIAPNLESLLGKSIDDLCTQRFHDAEANHCAHFVSHIGGYQFGYLCHKIAGSHLNGVCVRVQELFPNCPQVGPWEDLPGTADDVLVFIVARRHVNLTKKTIENVPTKHIGIYRGGKIYHYSNGTDEVIRQTPQQVLTRFRSAYKDQTVELFYGTLPAVKRGIASKAASRSLWKSGLEPSKGLILRLERHTYTDISTIGSLHLDDKFQCYILEDKVRPEKIFGVTAIPAGTYEVDITHSPKFQRDLPLLQSVPKYSGIRIHPGNTAEDTEGCLLPGRTKAIDYVGDSRKAFNSLLEKLVKAKEKGKQISIEIVEFAPRSVTRSAATSADPESGEYFRVRVDPIEMRSIPDEANVEAIIATLEFGSIVRSNGLGTADEWVSVDARDGLSGLVPVSGLEPVPAPESPPTRTGARAAKNPMELPGAGELYRVNTKGTNLRSEAAVIRPDTVVASLAEGQIVSRIGFSPKPLWWKASTVLHGVPLKGFVRSDLLSPIGSGTAQPSTQGNSSGVTVSEAALQLILSLEGIDQPSKWPGNESGISLGRGYDLGHVSTDEFASDWEAHLTPDQIKRLSKAIGKKGSTAQTMAQQFADITIKKTAADSVFTRSTLPKFKLTARKAFPRVTSLHPDAQGALVCLVFNRGAAMEGERRREMREVRDAVASDTLSRVEKLRQIAKSLRSMKRIWPDTPGLQRRREAEAKLVEQAI